MKYHVEVNGKVHEVAIVERLGELLIEVDGAPFDAAYTEVDDLGQVVVLHEGQSYALSIEGDENLASITLAGHHYDVVIEDERERAAHAAERAAGKSGGIVTAVMPGVVVEVLAKKGDAIEKGAPLLILSAMKMQNEIAATASGVVKEVFVSAGQAVAAGAKLASISETP